MRGIIKFNWQVVIATLLLLVAVAAQAQLTTYTSRVQFAADDRVDWLALGVAPANEKGLQVANPFNVNSVLGTITVNGGMAVGAFRRYDEGLGWHGDFFFGDHLMTTNTNLGPMTLSFSTGPVFGVGTMVQMNGLGPFTATLTAKDKTGAVLATATVTGNSTSNLIGDGSAPFMGLRSTTANIALVQINVTAGGLPVPFAINELDLGTKAKAPAAKAYDFNGDGKSDILWRNTSTGDNVIWLMNGTSITTGAAFSNVADPNYQIAGAGDFNGDGKADILWRNSVTGDNVIWLMNGASITTGALFSNVSDPNWHIVGIGDFDGDGKADILWRNSVTGANVIWLMNGTSVGTGAAFSTVADLNWQAVGVGDFDGDGKADILWRNSLTGDNVMWLMNGTLISNGAAFSNVADPNWHVVGVGDFNADGKSDILWRNSATGDNVIWLMNGTLVTTGAAFSAVADLNWKVAGVRDFNGDGNADILWRNPVTGDNVIWLMNGTSITSGVPFSNVAGASWQPIF